MTFRMLVLDLDGTTLDADRKVRDVDIAAAYALQAMGVHITIATGRLFGGTAPVGETLGLAGTVATMNGSELTDLATGETRHLVALDDDAVHSTRRILQQSQLSTFLFGSRILHHSEADARHRPYLGIWTPALKAHADVFEADAWGADLLSVGAVGDRAAIDAARVLIEADLGPGHEVVTFPTYAGETFLSIRPSTEDKGTALRRLAQERGIAPEECVAVGDWWNDGPMLQAAGHGFAMGHAPDPIKLLADEVLVANRHEGAPLAEVAWRVWGVRV